MSGLRTSYKEMGDRDRSDKECMHWPRRQSTWTDNVPSGKAALGMFAVPTCSKLHMIWVAAPMG